MLRLQLQTVPLQTKLDASLFRCAELEKEVAALKQKIHHLDDMLKSQQRKVRHMIEQVRESNLFVKFD